MLVCLEESAEAKVRADYGSVCDSFVFIPAMTRYSTPGVAMKALNRFVDDALTTGASSAWSIGAIPFTGDGRDGRWIRYEDAVLALFADRPLRAVCLYDAHTTPKGIRDGVLRSHQSVVGDWVDSPGAAVETPPAPPWPSRKPDVVVTGAVSSEVRESLRRGFERSVSSESLADLLLVATELVSNATRHGAPPVETRAWHESASLVLQVRDAGTAVIDEYADLRPCTGGAHGGFGLFVVGQLADSVDTDRHEEGNTVTVHLPTQR